MIVGNIKSRKPLNDRGLRDRYQFLHMQGKGYALYIT